MAVKPLKRLLDEANALLKCASESAGSRMAAPQEDDVSALASLLAGADAPIAVETSALDPAEMDKIAESLNRAITAAEIAELHKLAGFEKRASEEGYSSEQIQEVFSKVAAGKLVRTLPILMATGFFGYGRE